LANITLIDTDIVTVSELEYLRNVSLIINQQSPRTLQNYMVWRFIMNQVSYMPQRFRTIVQKFDRVFRGINTQQSRRISCGVDVNNIMGFAVAKLYKDEYFDQNARSEVPEITVDLTALFLFSYSHLN
jgi:membrane metallo-endopeptidase-like protein 1